MIDFGEIRHVPAFAFEGQYSRSVLLRSASLTNILLRLLTLSSLPWIFTFIFLFNFSVTEQSSV